MKLHYTQCLLISTMVLLGCSHKTISCAPNSKLGNLRSLNLVQASADAEHAFASGDRRLLGVYGMALEVPGLTGNPDNYQYGIKPLDGTGDTICSDEERRLNGIAREYAQQYNTEVLLLLKHAE